jgi:serine/threonine protein kinase
MTCLADEVVAAWLDGALADHERAVAIEHASSCETCRELVGAVFDSERLPVTIGRYEIAGTIGGGGMGVVVRGRDPVLARDVAIKLARAGVDDKAQMLREAQALAKLSHPNVVAVHDFGESGGEVFVAMALVEGVPLSRWLAAPHAMAERVRVLEGVAAGLAAIHDANLVHRDIKPDNVVIRASLGARRGGNRSCGDA